MFWRNAIAACGDHRPLAALRQLVRDCPLVGRPVIDNDCPPMTTRLRQQAVECVGKRIRGIVRRNCH